MTQRIDVVHPSELGPAEIAHWRSLIDANRVLWGPYFTPEFAKAVGQVRQGARVAVLHTEQGIGGFFTAQRMSRFIAMPLGAPISDYQGVIGAPDLLACPKSICQALNVGRVDFSHMLAAQQGFAPLIRELNPSWVAPLAGGSAGYLAALRAKRAEQVRQQDKKRRKFIREVGEPVFTASSTNRAHFETLLDWKNAQCSRTGQPKVWATKWVRQLVEAAWASTDPEFGAHLATWDIDGRLIAANFLLRSRRVLHDWIIAHDHEFDRYSPGLLLGRQMVEWAADNGYAEVDFGPGESQYKRVLTLEQRDMGPGFFHRNSFSGFWRSVEYAACGALARVPNKAVAALPGKAMRRMDLLRGLGLGATLADPLGALKQGAGAFRVRTHECRPIHTTADPPGLV
jgi:CelD/BcsL family acetyltransferase involved in cellulose biosynthesis